MSKFIDVIDKSEKTRYTVSTCSEVKVYLNLRPSEGGFTSVTVLIEPAQAIELAHALISMAHEAQTAIDAREIAKKLRNTAAATLSDLSIEPLRSVLDPLTEVK